uniref:tRNA-specific 2-thiouridylase MnmA n=1 Tax=candidate division CPR3 bacterium TaxID=2268181 RepID=A0A7C4M2F2_UNCC3
MNNKNIKVHKINKKGKRVVVAMSGGVDSSVAALLLKKKGYDVIGIFLKLWQSPCDVDGKKRQNLCCDDKAMLVARQIADKLNIPFYVIKVDNLFKKEIVDNFISEYEKGLTPNPCVRCNRYIKFGYLWEKARELGADYLATGHYVRVAEIPNLNDEMPNKISNPKSQKKKNKISHYNLELDWSLGFGHWDFNLFRSKDIKKDQTYFLSTINPEVIPHLLFPLGDMEKSEVREIARKNGLPVYDKKDSAGICFIPDGDTDSFLSHHSKKKKKPGNIVDKYGNVLGKHKGLMGYTVGEKVGDDNVASSWNLVARKKNSKSQLPTTKYSKDIPRLYITKIDPKKNQLVVGENEDCFAKEMVVSDFNIINPDFFKYIDGKKTVLVQIRGGHSPEKATLFLENQKSKIKNQKLSVRLGRTIIDGSKKLKSYKLKASFLSPVRAITPGQTAAVYTLKGELLGGGVISS